MPSHIRSITTRALVVAIGGAIFIAGPTPAAAATELERPEPFTAAVSRGAEIQDPVCENVDGVTRCREKADEWFIAKMSDPRLDGDMRVAQSWDKYAGNHWLVSYVFRIETDDGAWQGSSDTTWSAGDSGAFSVFLEGEGAYEGLHAWMDVTDWRDVTGVIFPAAPPETPTIRLATTNR